MYKLFSKVQEFNIQVLGLHAPHLSHLQSDQAKHLSNCIEEELNELKMATLTNDFIASVDALTDIIYFAVGGLHKMGLSADDAEKVFELVHNANMTKQKGVKESRAVGEAPDAIKPEGWESPETLMKRYFFEE